MTSGNPKSASRNPKSEIGISKSLKHLPPLLAFLASLAFSVYVYPDVAAELANSRVVDRYDALGKGLLFSGTLAYYPDIRPTTERTPLYPALFALAIALAGENPMIPLMIIHALMHGATTLLVVLLVQRFSNRRRALLAGFLCAMHPILLWYSGRFVIETLLTLLITLAMYAAVAYWSKPGAGRAFAAGAAFGIGLWCKAVFAPLLILLPILILMRKGARRRALHAAIVLGTAFLIIAPWLIRNQLYTGRFPLFQSVVGLNLYISDEIAHHTTASSLLSFGELHARVDYAEKNRIEKNIGGPDSRLAWREGRLDERLVQRSLGRYLREPLFFAKRLGLNAFWFWALGSGTRVTVFAGGLQIILLAAAFWAAFTIRKKHGISSPFLIPFWFAMAYFIAHALVFAVGRFSAPLIPSLLALVAFAVRRPIRNKSVASANEAL